MIWCNFSLLPMKQTLVPGPLNHPIKWLSHGDGLPIVVIQSDRFPGFLDLPIVFIQGDRFPGLQDLPIVVIPLIKVM